jgi:hypothetical protein
MTFGWLHHEQAPELIAVLGDPRVASRDDSGVVIGHRRWLAPHAGDVFSVRADGQTLHRWSIARLSQPQHHLLGTRSGRIRRGSHGLVWLAGDSGFGRASPLVLTS